MRVARRPSVRAPRQRPVSQTITLPAPTNGWVTNENLKENDLRSAKWMENWLPTEDGVRLRAGATQRALITGAVETVFYYEADTNSRLFASSSSAIYDVTSPASATVAEDPVQTQLTNGVWHFAGFSNVADNQYTLICNGADWARIFDGSDWAVLADGEVFKLTHGAPTGTFTVGNTLTGATSSATGIIVDVRPSEVHVKDVTGTFQSGEVISDATGSATTTAAAVSHNAQIITSSDGIDSRNLTGVVSHQRRLWFVEAGTLWAHYLPSLQFAGALTSFNLSAVFKRGGQILFADTYSVDAGDGMDDRLVFVTDQGEVAVYAGDNPEALGNFRLEGRYDVGRPLGQKAKIKAGGDLLIATEEGIIPLSQVARRDAASLSAAAVTRPIEQDWRASVRERISARWEMAKDYVDNWLLVSLPATSGQDTRCYVVNLKTGSWALWTGWDAQCLSEFGGNVFYGDSAGRVVRAESGGTDLGTPILHRLAGPYSTFGAGVAYKHVSLARAVLTASTPIVTRLSISSEFEIAFPAAPDAAPPPAGVLVWDQSNWDEAVWGSNNLQTIYTGWQSIPGNATQSALQLQLTTSGADGPDVVLAGWDVQVEAGVVVQ